MIDIVEKRYNEHRQNARRRGIAFLLTFEEWWAIWRNSGRWSKRGWRKGQYVMARYGDRGAYEVTNVRICLAEENRQERNRIYASMPGETNPAHGKDYWATMSDHARERRRLQISERFRDKPKPPEWRAMMSATTTGRRKVIRDGSPTWAHPGDCDYPNEGTY